VSGFVFLVAGFALLAVGFALLVAGFAFVELRHARPLGFGDLNPQHT
jgi:hypothetical protein